MAEGGNKKATEPLFSRLLFSPYVICLRSEIHPVAYPKYTILYLCGPKIFMRVKFIPIPNELYDSEVWIRIRPRLGQMHYFWWGSLTHALLFYKWLVMLRKHSTRWLQGYWCENT